MKAKALSNGSLPIRIGKATLISRHGTCDMLTTIMLSEKDNMIRDVPMQEGDTKNIIMRKCPIKKGMQDHYVRWIKVGTTMVEMAQHELKCWLLPRIKGTYSYTTSTFVQYCFHLYFVHAEHVRELVKVLVQSGVLHTTAVEDFDTNELSPEIHGKVSTLTRYIKNANLIHVVHKCSICRP